jgi:hypothetical protein
MTEDYLKPRVHCLGLDSQYNLMTVSTHTLPGFLFNLLLSSPMDKPRHKVSLKGSLLVAKRDCCPREKRSYPKLGIPIS